MLNKIVNIGALRKKYNYGRPLYYWGKWSDQNRLVENRELETKSFKLFEVCRRHK